MVSLGKLTQVSDSDEKEKSLLVFTVKGAQ